MRLLRKIFVLALLLPGARVGYCQGFVNLNFEAANNLGVPGSFSELAATNAFPGWTVTDFYTVYDDFSLSGNSISICDTNGPFIFPEIQGKYFAYLAAGNYSDNNGHVAEAVSLRQTGTIPSWANSITFWGDDEGMQVTFDGQQLSFSALGSTANYTIYGATISEFAGQTGELLFTAPPFTDQDELDNIQFSPSPVPEPCTLGLSAVGGLFLVLRRWKTRAM